MKQIHQYFTGELEIVLLPQLVWDEDQKPNFNQDGFYLDYEHILAAHREVRDRMLYGLNKISFFINKGVVSQDSYFINCENFEELIAKVYHGW